MIDLAVRERTRPDPVVALRLVVLVVVLLTSVAQLTLRGRDSSLGRLVSDLQHGRTHHVLVIGDRVMWLADGIQPRSFALPVTSAAAAGVEDASNVFSAKELEELLARYPGVDRDVVAAAPIWADPRDYFTLASGVDALLPPLTGGVDLRLL